MFTERPIHVWHSCPLKIINGSLQFRSYLPLKDRCTSGVLLQKPSKKGISPNPYNVTLPQRHSARNPIEGSLLLNIVEKIWSSFLISTIPLILFSSTMGWKVAPASSSTSVLKRLVPCLEPCVFIHNLHWTSYFLNLNHLLPTLEWYLQSLSKYSLSIFLVTLVYGSCPKYMLLQHWLIILTVKRPTSLPIQHIGTTSPSWVSTLVCTVRALSLESTVGNATPTPELPVIKMNVTYCLVKNTTPYSSVRGVSLYQAKEDCTDPIEM